MAPAKVLRGLISSYCLRVGVIVLSPGACIELLIYAFGDARPSFTLELKLALLFLGGAILELWLRSESGSAAVRPLVARMRQSGIWRELNKPNPRPIANSVTVTVGVVVLMSMVMFAAMMAAIAFIDRGLSSHVIEVVLDVWPAYAIVAGFGVFWLFCHHAGINPERAFNRLILWGAIGYLGFVAGTFWTNYSELKSQHHRSARLDFNKAIMSASVPCVAVKDKLSDLSACSVFGLRPGITQSEVLDIVHGSGYFRKKEEPTVCTAADKCRHYVSYIEDGLYLRVEFRTDSKSAAPTEKVSRIVLSLNESAYPYFDEHQVMATFLKLIGSNGSSVDTEHVDWIDIKNVLKLSAYTYERAFWAIFSSELDDQPNPPGVPV